MAEQPTWLGVPAVDGARVGPLRLSFCVDQTWCYVREAKGAGFEFALNCSVRESDAKTREAIRSLAALLGPEEPRWIQCSERMPDVSTLVDVWVPAKLQARVCWLTNDEDAARWCDEVCDSYGELVYYDLEQVSHWRERPSAPESPR